MKDKNKDYEFEKGVHCKYCGKSLKGYSWVDVATHFKEKHNISILDRDK